jgi:hypothetical protein
LIDHFGIGCASPQQIFKGLSAPSREGFNGVPYRFFSGFDGCGIRPASGACRGVLSGALNVRGDATGKRPESSRLKLFPMARECGDCPGSRKTTKYPKNLAARGIRSCETSRPRQGGDSAQGRSHCDAACDVARLPFEPMHQIFFARKDRHQIVSPKGCVVH